MNLIYMCVFHQESYIHLLKVLIRSISIKADINKETTDILIITSPSFQPLIQKALESFDLPLQYYILNLRSLFEAGCARLNIFKYEHINKYDNILYLDTDILLNSDVNVLFNLELSSEKLYALQESSIGDHDYYGSQFFDFTIYKRELPAFTSGILLFKNSDCMKSLFDTIQSHIHDYIYIQKNKIPECLDQPFIVYNAISQNKYDNQVLKPYAKNNPSDVSPEKIIYHFPGGPGKYGSKISKMNAFWEKMSEVAFITLSNSGYIKFTLNCLESLKRIGLPSQLLHSYVIGKEGYNILKTNGYKCTLIDDEANSNFQTFRNGNWGDIVFNKFQIIYENLLNYKYVCFTDGDIVFENKDFLQYLKDNIDTYDMLAQSEGDMYEDFCSGFMYIKSTEITRSIFNPENVLAYKRPGKWGDQIYLNEIRKKVNLNYKKLPLELFPNGKYYYSNSKISPYLIHFNWVVGNEKVNRMRQYGKWYDKLKICQYGSDGFGHQLEGILRLISISLNNKAEYMYDLRKEFKFEHSNFDINILNSYLLKAMAILSSNSIKSETTTQYKINYSERRTFETIIKNDVNYSNTIYSYDGIGDGPTFPPNFEYIDDLKKSLPKLRNAFVLENPFLPKPSYDNQCMNVVCHIRLGDAIGTRVLDNDKIITFIKNIQKESGNRITIHSDGDIDSLKADNTILCGKNTDVLQILSDFVHADVFIMNYSSLSIAAHLLGHDNQKVFCPSVAGKTFYQRILRKCIKISSETTLSTKSFPSNNELCNKKYSWQKSSITFLENGQMNAFGKGTYTQQDTYIFQANFGGRIHTLVFNNDYTEFTSTRKGDGEKVEGQLM